MQAAPDICCAAREVSEAGEASEHSLSQPLSARSGCSPIRETEAPKLLGRGQLQPAQLQLYRGQQWTAEDCAPLLLHSCTLLDQSLNPLQSCLRGGRAHELEAGFDPGKALRAHSKPYRPQGCWQWPEVLLYTSAPLCSTASLPAMQPSAARLRRSCFTCLMH